MQRYKIILHFIWPLPLSYLIAFALDNKLNDLINVIFLPLLGVFLGIMLAAIGIIVGGFHSLLKEASEFQDGNGVTKTDIDRFLQSLKSSMSEFKNNLKFMVYSLVGVVFLIIFRESNLPLVQWPSDNYFSSKLLVSNSLIIYLSFLSIIALLDSVNAMFAMNRISEIVIEKKRK